MILLYYIPYQCLPRSSLSERIPLVILVWSACGLPTVTTTSDVPDDPFWLVWILLPIPTKSRIWLGPGRRRPLPTITTAATDSQRTHICGVIMEAMARVGHARHSGTHGRTVAMTQEGYARWRSVSKRKFSNHQAGRHAFLNPWW